MGQRLGPSAEARFLRGFGGLDVEGPAPEDFDRMAQLVNKYAGFPLGGTDASVIALADRIGAPANVTHGHRHFATIKPLHLQAPERLP